MLYIIPYCAVTFKGTIWIFGKPAGNSIACSKTYSAASLSLQIFHSATQYVQLPLASQSINTLPITNPFFVNSGITGKMAPPIIHKFLQSNKKDSGPPG